MQYLQLTQPWELHFLPLSDHNHKLANEIKSLLFLF